MAISEFAFALVALLTTFLVPVLALYQLLRLKRRAIRVSPSTAPRGDHR